MSQQKIRISHNRPWVGTEPIPSEDPFYDYETTPNFQYRHTMPFAGEPKVGFGGFTAGELAVTGVVSFAITRWLGASLPGAIVMGVGNMLWEGGSSSIAPGWKRYILGLFRKPHNP